MPLNEFMGQLLIMLYVRANICRGAFETVRRVAMESLSEIDPKPMGVTGKTPINVNGF